MPFLSKDELASEAERLGVDISNLPWPQAQSAVAQAKAAASQNSLPNKVAQPLQKNVEDPMSYLNGKIILITPEIAPTFIQNYKYDEDIGEDMEVEDVYYNFGQLSSGHQDGNFRITKNHGRRLLAQSSLPKIGSAIYYDPRPGRDLVPITSFQGREGYIWSHPSLPGIKNLLRQAHYYERMKDRFIPNRVWYSANKILACDIATANEVFREIEEMEALKRVNRQ